MKTVTVALLLTISAMCQSGAPLQSLDFWAATRNLSRGHIIQQSDLNHRHIDLRGLDVPREYRNCLPSTAILRDYKLLHEVQKNQCIMRTDVSWGNKMIITRPER